jgi:hypothetical protein
MAKAIVLSLVLKSGFLEPKVAAQSLVPASKGTKKSVILTVFHRHYRPWNFNILESESDCINSVNNYSTCKICGNDDKTKLKFVYGPDNVFSKLICLDCIGLSSPIQGVTSCHSCGVYRFISSIDSEEIVQDDSIECSWCEKGEYSRCIGYGVLVCGQQTVIEFKSCKFECVHDKKNLLDDGKIVRADAIKSDDPEWDEYYWAEIMGNDFEYLKLKLNPGEDRKE